MSKSLGFDLDADFKDFEIRVASTRIEVAQEQKMITSAPYRLVPHIWGML
jgi:hypothetical protein